MSPRTRVLAVTWVHSSTGVKLPIAEIAKLVGEVNAKRDAATRVLLCVDGVHGLGVENVTLRVLGCDAFAAGTHKWLFGPRGTGLLWASPDTWPATAPIVPSFDPRAFGPWLFNGAEPQGIPGPLHTPGGFHSFEHRWALAEAFRFHERIGKARIEARTHELATRLKAGLGELRTVELMTPISPQLSAGIVCFTVAGRRPEDVVDLLWRKHRIVASATPYSVRYVRLGPSIVNSEADVDRALAAVQELA